MFTKILYATDGSEASEVVLRYTIDIAKTYAAEVIVVHAYDPVPALLGTPFYYNMLEPRLNAGENLLHEVIAKFAEWEVEAHHELLEGPPCEAILKVAQAEDCDLIILGTRGLGKLGEMLGGTCREVMRQAHCPVLIVPCDNPEP
jgi:nucleotide-binding universal stress UspA family protein